MFVKVREEMVFVKVVEIPDDEVDKHYSPSEWVYDSLREGDITMNWDDYEETLDISVEVLGDSRKSYNKRTVRRY